MYVLFYYVNTYSTVSQPRLWLRNSVGHEQHLSEGTIRFHNTKQSGHAFECHVKRNRVVHTERMYAGKYNQPYIWRYTEHTAVGVSHHACLLPGQDFLCARGEHTAG